MAGCYEKYSRCFRNVYVTTRSCVSEIVYAKSPSSSLPSGRMKRNEIDFFLYISNKFLPCSCHGDNKLGAFPLNCKRMRSPNSGTVRGIINNYSSSPNGL